VDKTYTHTQFYGIKKDVSVILTETPYKRGSTLFRLKKASNSSLITVYTASAYFTS